MHGIEKDIKAMNGEWMAAVFQTASTHPSGLYAQNLASHFGSPDDKLIVKEFIDGKAVTVRGCSER
jgi:hypothetical protein